MIILIAVITKSVLSLVNRPRQPAKNLPKAVSYFLSCATYPASPGPNVPSGSEGDYDCHGIFNVPIDDRHARLEHGREIASVCDGEGLKPETGVAVPFARSK